MDILLGTDNDAFTVYGADTLTNIDGGAGSDYYLFTPLDDVLDVSAPVNVKETNMPGVDVFEFNAEASPGT